MGGEGLRYGRSVCEVWVDRWVEGEGKGGCMGLALSWNKTKRLKFASSFTSPEKENYLFYIYEVITWEKILKRGTNQ